MTETETKRSVLSRERHLIRELSAYKNYQDIGEIFSSGSDWNSCENSSCHCVVVLQDQETITLKSPAPLLQLPLDIHEYGIVDPATS